MLLLNPFISHVQASAFTAMTNTYGAVWEASNLPAFPLDLRLTDSLGHSVVAAYEARAFVLPLMAAFISVHLLVAGLRRRML